MAYRPSAEEMSGDLPEWAGGDGDSKAQLLLVAEILRLFTDEGHGLTAEDIREAIGLRTGRRPSLAKVRDDIHTLAECRLFGMDIVIPSRGEAGGFRCRKTYLSSEDARLAINMVRTCKFVTREQRDRVCEELFGMVSYYQQDEIARSVVVDERDLPSSPDVFAAAEAFSYAIEEGLMVRFRYAARGLDGVERFSVNHRDGTHTFEETPIALVFSFGSYYAETWAGEEQDGRKVLRRLDRVRDAVASSTPAASGARIDELRATVQERIGQTFDMFDDGEARDLFLRVSGRAARYVYDRFGHGVRFLYIADDGSHGYIHVRVKLAPTFYRWLFGMGSQIVLTKPQGALWESAFWADKGAGQARTHDELVADYEEAVAGMKEQMTMVGSVYGWELR